MAADYSPAGLAAAAGIDPWALHDQVRTGDPTALQGGALRLRRAGTLAADAATGGQRADRDLGAAFSNDGTPVFDAAASTRRGDQLLADRGDKIEETARTVLEVAGGLSDTTTSTASRIADLDTELDRIIGLRNAVQVTGPDPAAVAAALATAERRYHQMAVDAVKTAGGRVQADLDDYDALLRNRTARLEGLGYGVPAPARPAARAAVIPEPGEPGGPEPDPIVQLITLLAELGAAIASALGGGPSSPGAPPHPDHTLPSRPPDPSAVPRGRPKKIQGNEEDRRGRGRENEASQILAKAGYDVEQLPESRIQGIKNPDLRVEGRIFDVYSPSTDNVERIGDKIVDKVGKEQVGQQADRVVVYLADSSVTKQQLRQQLHDHPVPRLKEVMVIDQQGNIDYVYP